MRNRMLLLILIVFAVNQSPTHAQMQKLKIGPYHRFLVKENGDPFVWIGETNWFFAKLPPETIDRILDKRQAQGFTIMFVSCREQLYNGDGGPGSLSQPNEAWWSYLDDYVDAVISFTRREGLVPTVVHGHYADGGYIAKEVAAALGDFVESFLAKT